MKKKLAKLLWLTGLSGSGKTTLANSIYKDLLKNNFEVLKIDGDIFRKKKKNINNFSKKNITNNNNEIISYVKKIEKRFDFVIVSVISPLLLTRKKAKNTFGCRYFEIYVKCSIKELIKRDTKGLYQKAKDKVITNLIGYNSKIKYEKSKYKKIIVNTDKLNLLTCKKLIIKKILN
jgi:adenylylsulfate kinase-like enzyme